MAGNLSENVLPRILIVDDDWLMQDLMEAILTTEGYPIIQTQRAEKAISIAQDEQPDLIILDVRLPKMSGFEICTVLKNDLKTANIPILLITGHKTAADEIKAQEALADLFVERTINSDVLLKHINFLLNQ